jgi:hypothetical protein
MSTTINKISIGETSIIGATSGTGLSQISGTATLQTPSAAPGIGNTSGGAGTFDREYSITGTVTAGTPFTINLMTGADSFANTLGMVHVGRIHAAHQGTTGKIVVGAGTHPIMGSDQGTATGRILRVHECRRGISGVVWRCDRRITG